MCVCVCVIIWSMCPVVVMLHWLVRVSFVRLLEGYGANDGRQLSYLALEESVFYKQGFMELGALLQSADPLLMEPAERKTLFISILKCLMARFSRSQGILVRILGAHIRTLCNNIHCTDLHFCWKIYLFCTGSVATVGTHTHTHTQATYLSREHSIWYIILNATWRCIKWF